MYRFLYASAMIVLLTACARNAVPAVPAETPQSYAIYKELSLGADSLPKCHRRFIFVQKKTLLQGPYTITATRRHYAFVQMTVRNHLRAAKVTVTAGKVTLVVKPAHVRSATITGKTIVVSQSDPGKGPGVEVNAETCKRKS